MVQETGEHVILTAGELHLEVSQALKPSRPTLKSRRPALPERLTRALCED